MKYFELSGFPNPTSEQVSHVFCPTLNGLSGRQADLAMVMPRLDNNRALFDIRPVERVSYAGVLTCDPFGTADNFLRRLADHGYVGVSNWPSAILFQGHTKRMMASMPATPELEYAWLAGAQRHGFQSLAFFRSLEQGRAALSAGLRQLVLHPGLIPQTTGGPPDLLIASLGDLIEKLRHQVDGVEILLYEHVGLNEAVQATDVGADGALIFKATP